jgi:hypothetical protein
MDEFDLTPRAAHSTRPSGGSVLFSTPLTDMTTAGEGFEEGGFGVMDAGGEYGKPVLEGQPNSLIRM